MDSHQNHPDSTKSPIRALDAIGLKKNIFLIIGIVAIAGVSFFLGFAQGRSSYAIGERTISPQEALIIQKNGDKVVDFSLFWRTWDLLKEKYVEKDKLDANAMMYGAIKGMLAATDDPYTTFFDPKENKAFQEEITGSFQGIGAEIGMKDGILTIIAPLDDSPAQKAGLQAGDKILKIDDKDTVDMDLEKAVSFIRGAKGTEVKLVIFRSGDKENQTHEITVKRDVINVKSVKLEIRDHSIAYIKVSRFGDDTQALFEKAINEAVNQKSKALIIDLRNNPGGYLETAVSMASLMLPNHSVVVIEEDGNGKQEKLYSQGSGRVSTMETVILINEGSASASEILAGALHDNRSQNVTLIGKKSFGKGSVQELIPLSKDTSVKITVAKWLTPQGKQINHEGITPDKVVDITDEDREKDRDPQLDSAIALLKEKLHL